MINENSKKIAVMQPYLFPYLGYFQLVAAVDEFWLLDDVQFIRRGWMNRNNIIVNGNKHLFTIPVMSGKQSDLIQNKLYDSKAKNALSKLKKVVEQSYANALFLERVLTLLDESIEIFEESGECPSFIECTEFTLQRIFQMLNLDTPIYRSSRLKLSTDLKGGERIQSICRELRASTYVNMIGGRHLYDVRSFNENNLKLCFLQPNFPRYFQFLEEFTPGLSILDILAHVDNINLPEQLNAAKLIEDL